VTRTESPGSGSRFSGPLVEVVDDSLALLHQYTKHAVLLDSSDALPSLLAQCQALVQDSRATPAEPIRLVHHFAGTGGTLFCKWLATAPNTVLLSEVDPLSRLQIPADKWPFAPTDLLRLLRCNPRSSDIDLIETVFLGALKALYSGLNAHGQRLILRDHSHSRYCFGSKTEDRSNLLQLVRRQHPVKAIVTVRHPLDSFLSITNNNFLHFEPKTLEEYSRRYLAFLEDFEKIPIFKYEEFVADSALIFSQICDDLSLPVSPAASDTWQSFLLSGDSGRSGKHIAPRKRREILGNIQDQLGTSPSYTKLCDRLDYDVDPEDAQT